MSRGFDHVRFISAGAGSGKTYRLTEELERALTESGVAPERILGTTFTVKAAAELRQRVRERLIQRGRPAAAEQIAQALIGTVHSVCERLLKRFAFELGLSPELRVASLEDGSALFAQALDEVLSIDQARTMNRLAARLDLYEPVPGRPRRSWRDDVQDLAAEARCNDIDAAALPRMGQASADALLAFFPPPRPGNWDEALLDAVRDALDHIDPEQDTTTTTHRYVESLTGAIYRLRRPAAPWSDWISLSTAKAAKKSEPAAATVRARASAYAWHPDFHAELRGYTEQIFGLAAAALDRFQALKLERGLIDFTDMEQRMLHALDLPVIRDQIAADLELLLVDEFQDTNPMQLAIFMKLAALADHAVFVGDVKQAIYAFRGCDPDLVFATLEGLARQGSAADVLPHSWRSRPALVHYVNAVFSQAFAAEIEPQQIVLAPQREDATAEPALLHWAFDGNTDARAEALADAIADFVQSGYRVVDPDTKSPRAVRWGDIAILAMSNANVERIAAALRRAQIPMKMSLQGLLAVPEVCLAKACLRRLNDRSDTLASAEIIAMSDCTEPELWLADRLRWLAESRDGYAWAEDSHAILGPLTRLREQIGTQSPVEIVARVLNYVGLREVVTAWGPNAIKAAQRQRNLDALLQLAVEYEDHCDAQHLAATLTGFLFWLDNPHSAELDLQPVVTTGDAVHVLTYHRSKGLEWPVVINTDFHSAWRARLWDIRVESRSVRFDLEAPLADREIRFWPPIFGKRSKDLPVLDAIIASAEGQDCLARSAAETRRVAYVGMTRARDALVLALPDLRKADGGTRKRSDDAWFHAFASEALVPDGETLTLPDGRTIPTRCQRLAPQGADRAPPPYTPRRLPARAPADGLPRESVSPSSAGALGTARIAETVEIGPRLALAGDDMTAIGQGLHAVIAAELINPGRADALARAQALLAGMGVEPYIRAADALAAAQRFARWLETRFAPRQILAEHPVLHRLDDGRLVRGWIDVLIETQQGWIVIDHKSSPRPRSEWPDEAIDYAGQLACYRAALRASGRPVLDCWLHFPVTGGAVRVIEA